QFALEYITLFSGLLPALERMQVPMPLGGTSNHFRRQALLASGLWDPFNVTEDADLGLRLARQGRRIAVLNSTTWEEAPAEFNNWLPQRTRWIKGWLQTYLVHTRSPARLLSDLGFIPFLGFHCLIGGFLLSVFLHPLFYLIVAIELLQPIPFQAGQGLVNQIFWGLALFNLVVGTFTAIAFSILAAARQKRWGLAYASPLMPVYWLLVSFAAYRAAFHLVIAPYRWEKTRHKARWRSPPHQ
ncbi:MAG: glycosyltransferase, partial [Pseudomonadota bacterium]